MADESELYLENLDEFINDEDKIVTYKWLSRTLSVTSNQAKQMLFSFLTKQQEANNNQLNVTYLVGGQKDQNGELMNQFVLVNEDRLDGVKSQFQLITSVHVYSIQKQKPKDSNSLYMVDYEIQNQHRQEENRWSHIYCKEAARLTDGGVGRASSSRIPAGKENSLPSTSSKTINGNTAEAQTSKPAASKPKKGQLPTMGMFVSKIEKKSEEPKKVEASKNENKKEEKNENTAKKTQKSKPTGGMLSFFGKPTSGPSKKAEPKIEKKSEPKAESFVHEKMEKEEEKTEKKKEERKEEKELKKPIKKSNTEKGKQTRKRIKQLSSSEDEDETEDPLPKRLAPLAKDSFSDSEEEEAPIKSKGKKSRKNSDEEKKSKKREPLKKSRKASVDKGGSPEEKNSKRKRKRAKDAESEDSSEKESSKPSEPSVVTETPVQAQQTKSRLGESCKRRKRRRVLQNKTYMNDEGFMVTEKVYESESTDASDEEPVVEVKPQDNQKKPSPPSKPAAKKTVDPRSTKQASLMSFFGKK